DFPVMQSLPWLAGLFQRQGKVIVRVSVGGSQGDGRLVGANRVGQAPGLVQHIAQVEVGQRIARIDLYRLAVKTLGLNVVVAVVVKRSQVDVGGSVGRIKVDALFVVFNRLQLGARIFLQRDAAGKEVGRRFRRAHGVDLVRLHDVAFGEVHHELSRQG